jgi:hypothetical protein
MGSESTKREAKMRQEVASTSVSGEVRCIECDEPASGPATGWKAYLAGGFEGEPVEIIVFCPECAFHEFGSDA